MGSISFSSLARKIHGFRKTVKRKLRRRRPSRQNGNKNFDEVITADTSSPNPYVNTSPGHSSVQGNEERLTDEYLSDTVCNARVDTASCGDTFQSGSSHNAVALSKAEREKHPIKFPRESTKMLLRVSNRSLAHSNSTTADHQMKKKESEKCCKCENEELCPCKWDEGNDMVHLTNLICTPSRIWGRVQVNNIAYEKKIFIRWSHNNWESYCEQLARFEQSATNLRKDSFTFEIERSDHSETVELAVRYCVYDEEYWDNNGGTNYQVLGTY